MSFLSVLAVLSFLGGAVPLLSLIPPVRRFLFGDKTSEPPKAPTPLARATLAALGGVFGAGILLLMIFAVSDGIVIVEGGTTPPARRQANEWANAESVCIKGVLVGVSCYSNEGAETSGRLVKSYILNGKAHCDWIDLENKFVGHAQAICLRIGMK